MYFVCVPLQKKGLTERFNQTISGLVDESQTDWDGKIDTVLMGYRTSCIPWRLLPWSQKNLYLLIKIFLLGLIVTFMFLISWRWLKLIVNWQTRPLMKQQKIRRRLSRRLKPTSRLHRKARNLPQKAPTQSSSWGNRDALGKHLSEAEEKRIDGATLARPIHCTPKSRKGFVWADE